MCDTPDGDLFMAYVRIPCEKNKFTLPLTAVWPYRVAMIAVIGIMARNEKHAGRRSVYGVRAHSVREK
jgi:hypothetical protein